MASARDNLNGFSLIELLVVVSIISLLVGLSFPVISAMSKDTGRSNAVNTVAISASVARSFSERQAAYDFSHKDWPGTPGTTWDSETGTYSGVAAIFTPSGEIRLAENDATALSNVVIGGRNVPMERLFEEVTPAAPPDTFNGYKDIAGIDYIYLPRRAGVAGIHRDGGSNSFLAPPFAMRFDQFGKLQSSAASTSSAPHERNFVYYNADYDTVEHSRVTYNVYSIIGGARPATYDPSKWREVSPGGAEIHPDTNKLTLPFERLEAVIGVVVFDRGEFDDWGGWANWSNPDLTQDAWLEANGTPLFFSRYSGTVIRDPSP
jgi:prepilin-type N-terminal cleavage/methylation domain-containing protein